MTKASTHRAGKIAGIAIGAIVGALALLVLYLTLAEYSPSQEQEISIHGHAKKTIAAGDTLDIATWNIGYGGLSAQADFFMDGGNSVRSVSREGVENNLTAIESTLASLDCDFALLQEVDQDSERTYNINERARIATAFRGSYASAYALNYKVAYVPYPMPPIGGVESGIMTLSSVQPESAKRVQLPCPFDWPVRLGNLKRCLLVERIPIKGSKAELVLVNLHLEAYDEGEGKAAQTAQLAQLIQEERARGNYVIAGGDFNQSFSNVDTSMYPLQGDDLWQCGHIDISSLGEGVTAAMDNAVPTCRSLDRPYDASASFQYYMIDGFIVTDNVRIDTLETIDLGFEASDHNPVKITVTLL